MQTLDDFAVGINYNKEPYTSNNRFSVVVPDMQSQHKFFTVDNYTHKYITKGRYDLPKEESNDIVQTVVTKDKPVIPARDSGLVRESVKPKIEQEAIVKTPPRKSKSLEKTSAIKTSQPKTKTFIRLPKKVSVYNPGELYAAKNDNLNTKFAKTNPYKGTRYYNMVSVFGLNKDNTLGDVVRRSQEAKTSTQSILRMQQDKEFLMSQCLPPVPKGRVELRVTNTPVINNPSKKIGNEIHISPTYSRTTYGGYFMQ
eukprot:TRINITY_DN2745_c0_g5_i1.p1 TRINITY_DN2745_c0_g5~~TRINITY_DN2745_c0_g5_i1.p1  ORF type:complete len:255 (-),score=41.38 TRINITY_DN2745_c0_g5_i1:150-914(-)